MDAKSVSAPLSEMATSTVAAPSAGGVRQTIWSSSSESARV